MSSNISIITAELVAETSAAFLGNGMQGRAFGVSDTLPLSRNGKPGILPPSPGGETGFF